MGCYEGSRPDSTCLARAGGGRSAKIDHAKLSSISRGSLTVRFIFIQNFEGSTKKKIVIFFSFLPKEKNIKGTHIDAKVPREFVAAFLVGNISKRERP